jgi:hypothetical protein
MRTTIDLEDDLVRQAKFEAVRRGVTLRELFSQALEAELNGKPQNVVREHRATFPASKAKSDNPQVMIEEMIPQAQEDDDLVGEAKIEANRKGITFGDLVSEALKSYLHPNPEPRANPHRLTGGFFDNGAPGTFILTKEMIDQAELEDDMRRGGFLGYDDPA